MFFALAFSIRLWGLNAAGNVWDEYFYYDAVRDYTRAASQGDFRTQSWKTNKEHPPLGKYIYTPAVLYNRWQHVSDANAYSSLRFISAILGSITVVLVYLIGKRNYSFKIGVMAGLIYCLLPAVISYNKIVDLDVTMVFFFTLSMYFFFEYFKNNASKPLWWSVIFASLAIATKFNALFLFLIIYPVAAIYRWRKNKTLNPLKLPLPLKLFPLISVAILYLIWPWLWPNPWMQINQTVGHWGGKIYELFLGQVREGPLSYFVVHFLFGTPGLIIILTLVALFVILKRRKIADFVILFWLIMPFGISFYHLRQDHLRYILSVMPAVSLLSSIGFWIIVERFPRAKVAAKIAAGALVVYLAIIVCRIQPYYLSYYNEFIGGPRNVARHNLFKLGFYGEGIKEATDYINKTAKDGATVHYEIIPDDAPYLDRPRLSRQDNDEADYLVFNTNAMQDKDKKEHINTSGYKLEYSVKVGEAPFVFVYSKESK